MPKSSKRSMSLTSQESYSAVIIADLVADVPVSPDSEEARPRRSSSSRRKDDSNLGYDGQLDNNKESPAVINVSSMDGVNLKSVNANGAGSISKGVILNAMQFGPQDGKFKSDFQKGEKPILLNSGLTTQISISKEQPESDSIKEGFKEMSFSRKVAFCMSFLPSILFVLCFAVILPCDKGPLPEPCVQEKWIVTLNGTRIISEIQVPQNLVFSFIKDGQAGVMSIDKESGTHIWNFTTETKISYLECGNMKSNESKSCVMMDNNGIIYVFNASDGNVLWTRKSNELENTSNPIILPDCDKDGIDEIAVPVSRTKIEILFNGQLVLSINISGCDTIPQKLTAWSQNSTTDLVYSCLTGETETLFKIPECQWCSFSKEDCDEPLKLISRDQKKMKQSIIRPNEDGLALWVGNEIIMFESNGEERWKVYTVHHSAENRYLLYGKFRKEGKQLALFSSSIDNDFLVTGLEPLNGSIIWSLPQQNVEASNIVHLLGQNGDFVLVSRKEMKRTLTTEAATQINDVTSSIINFIANEEFNNRFNVTNDVIEKIVFMKPSEETIYVIEEKDVPKSYVVSTSLQQDKLTIYEIKENETHSEETATEIRSLDIHNWDITSFKNIQCSLDI